MSRQTESRPNRENIIGARSFSSFFEKFILSHEIQGYLSDLGATLRVTYSPNARAPTVEIVRDNKVLCATREFESLANYKIFLANAKEEVEKASKEKKIVAIYKNSHSIYNAKTGQTSPDRMVDANQTRFMSFQKHARVLEKNIEVLNTYPSSQSKDYMLNCFNIIKQFLVSELTLCMGPEKIESSGDKDKLLGLGVPYWMYLTSSNGSRFKEAKTADMILFPKGNYYGGITFKTYEILNDNFMVANEFPRQRSSSFISLARENKLRDWVIDRSSPLQVELDEQYENFDWPLLRPGTVEDFLRPRIDRAKIKSFSLIQPMKAKPGQKLRPETELQRETRKIKNIFGCIMHTMIDFFHLIPRTSDPLADFWSTVINTSGWQITPSNSIYDELKNPAHEHVLSDMMLNTQRIYRRKLAEIILLKLDVPSGSVRARNLSSILVVLPNNDRIINFGTDNCAPNVNALLTSTFGDLNDTSTINETVIEEMKVFRGLSTKALQKGEKNKVFRTKARLDKKTIRTLQGISDKDLYRKIELWIKENFRNEEVQKLAADITVAAIDDDEDLEYGLQNEDSDDDTSNVSSYINIH